MNSGKTILVLCLGLLAVQAHSVEIGIGGNTSAAEKIVNELKTVVQKAIHEGQTTLTGFIKQISSAALEFQKTFNATLNAACQPFIKQIDQAVAGAAKVGVDVSDCVGTSKSDILDLPVQLLTNVTSCVNDKVNDAEKIINNFASDVNNTINVVFGIVDELNNCRRQSFIILPICLTEVTTSCASSLVSLPLKIAKDVGQAKVFVATVIPSFAVCDVGAKASLGLRAASIVGDVTTCIAKKVFNHGSTTPASAGSTDGSTTTSKY